VGIARKTTEIASYAVLASGASKALLSLGSTLKLVELLADVDIQLSGNVRDE